MSPSYCCFVAGEDDPKTLTPQLSGLPIRSLGVVQAWGQFVKALSEGDLNRLTELQTMPLDMPGLIIGVDLNFTHDPTVPNSNEEMENLGQAESALRGVRWSQHVGGAPPMPGTPPTGAIVGWGLLMASTIRHPDVPIVVAPYSGYGQTIGFDAMAVLSVGQLIAATRPGVYGTSEYPFALACELVRELPSDAGEAVKAAMPALREQLLVRLGATPATFFPTLLPAPWSVESLMGIFCDAADASDLDSRLARSGLEAWTRDGTIVSFDLRSLFLDLLTSAGGGPPVLALLHVKTDGGVHKFISQIRQMAQEYWNEPAAVVQDNATELSSPTYLPKKRIIRRYANQTEESHAMAQLLGLVFASVEATYSSRKRLDERWDPEQDNASTSGTHTLRQYLQKLVMIFPSDEEMTEDSLLTRVRQLAAGHSAPACTLLGMDVTDDEVTQERRLRTLVGRAVEIDVVNRDARTKKLTCAMHPSSAQFSDSHAERKAVINKLLGWAHPEDNNLRRILKPFYPAGGLADALRLIINGDGGFPRHLRAAARWYHETYHTTDHKKGRCSPHCDESEG